MLKIAFAIVTVSTVPILRVPVAGAAEPVNCASRYVAASRRERIVSKVSETLGVVGGAAGLGIGLAKRALFPEGFVAAAVAPSIWFGGVLMNRNSEFDLLVAGSLDEAARNDSGQSTAALTRIVNDLVFPTENTEFRPGEHMEDLFQELVPYRSRLSFDYVTTDETFRAVRELNASGAACTGGSGRLSKRRLVVAVVRAVVVERLAGR